jgi:hypothetical protein
LIQHPSALDPTNCNLWLDLLTLDDTVPAIIKSHPLSSGSSDHWESPQMVTIDPMDLVGCTFLLPKHEDGQRFRVRIVECLAKHVK